jgi:protein subunit release factor B
MLRVTADIALDANELEESFIRSSVPGGQHVKILSTL